MKKQKLELTWIGKENRPKLEPRILLEDAEKSYHAKHRVTENDVFDNRPIFGDNLLALKAEFAGKVMRVFIDPPHNTSRAFTHYDDGAENSIWQSLMCDRLEIIRRQRVGTRCSLRTRAADTHRAALARALRRSGLKYAAA